MVLFQLLHKPEIFVETRIALGKALLTRRVSAGLKFASQPLLELLGYND
jgi:hypothetical protein